jgi:ERF superfamily protein
MISRKAKPKKKKKSTALAVHKPQLPAAPRSFLEVIMRAVADPRCDTGKMRELLAMQKEIDAEEARKAFTFDFMALTDDLPIITADRKIEIIKKGSDGQRVKGRDPIEQSTPYTSFNKMMDVLKRPLKAHSFSLSYSTEPSADGTRLIVWVYLDHVRGHQRKTAFPLPAETSGSKNNVQGWGSAQSYGMRYGTRALLNIISQAPEDADTDGRVEPVKTIDEVEAKQIEPTKITLDQCTALVAKIGKPETGGVGLDKFLEKYGVKAVIDLPPGLYPDACKACDDYTTAWKAARAKRIEA